MLVARPFFALLLLISSLEASPTAWCQEANAQRSGPKQPPASVRGAEPVDESSTHARRKLAVCVGINKYEAASGYKPLRFAGKDAIEMARTLLKDCQFDRVLLATDAELPTDVRQEFPETRLEVASKVTRTAIRDQAESLFSQATNRDDVVLIYFAGHGDTGDNGPYLITGDKPLLLGELFLAMRQPPSKAQNRILVLDACRSSAVDEAGTVLAPEFLREFALEEPRCVIWCGCGARESAYEDASLRHGRFTWAVLEALRGKAFAEGQERLLVSDVAARIKQTFEEQIEGKQWPASQMPSLHTARSFSLAHRRLPKPRAFGMLEWKKLAETHREADDDYRRNHLEASSELYQLCLRAVDSRLTAQAEATVSALHGKLLAKRARALFRLKEVEEAETLVAQARKLTPADPALAEYDAYNLLAKDKLEDSRARFEFVLPILQPVEESPPYLWSQYGGLLHKLKQYGEASHAFVTASRLYLLLKQPGDAAQQLQEAADCLGRAGNHVKAEEQLLKAKELLGSLCAGAKSLDYADLLDGFSACYQGRGQTKEALQFAQDALAARQELRQNDKHLDVLLARTRLALLHMEIGEYVEAKRHLAGTLSAAIGVGDDRLVLRAYSNLGTIGIESGEYRAAAKLFSEALAIQKSNAWDAEPAFSATLKSLAVARMRTGDNAEAAALFLKAMEMDERQLGAAHPQIADSLTHLGNIYRIEGQLDKSEEAFQRAIDIYKSVTGQQLGYASSVGDLGRLYQSQGKLGQAESLYQQALEIRKNLVGETHASYAAGLKDLAGLYALSNERERADAIWHQALDIESRALGRDHPEYVATLNSLAWNSARKNDPTRAESYFQQALEITRTKHGEKHPEYARSLENLASFYVSQKKLSEALPLLQSAVEIRKTALGAYHPDYAASLNRLATAYGALDNYSRAESLSKESLEATRKAYLFASVAPMPYSQTAMLANVRRQIDSLASVVRRDPAAASAAWDQVLAFKGLAQETRSRAASETKEPRLAPLLTQLGETNARLAEISRDAPSFAVAAAWKTEQTQLYAKLGELQQQIAAIRTTEPVRRGPVQMEEIRAALPKDAVYVDFLQYWDDLPRQSVRLSDGFPGERLAAMVVRRDAAAQFIDLGEMEPIRKAIDEWRQSFGRSLLGRDSGELLREKIWLPVEKSLGDSKLVLVSPDRDLGKLPFAALPGKRRGIYLLEDYAIAVVPLPLTVLEAANPRVDRKQRSDLLILADVDYDRHAQVGSEVAAAQPRQFGRAPRKDAAPFDRLPGSKGELAAIKLLYEGQKFDPLALTTMQAETASEEAFRREAPKHKYLHLATHGFFASVRYESALSHTMSERGQPGQAFLITEQTISGHHPNLLSGIALAGANHPPEEGDDGILTAEEVQSLDLRGTELVVLSACETGLGKTAGGEGLLGLQRAFQVAGAKSVIASLWKVDDAATQTMMIEFYRNLWERKLGKLEALRQAQIGMLKRYDPASRKLLVEADLSTDADKRLPPNYWAAFVLSGDWR